MRRVGFVVAVVLLCLALGAAAEAEIAQHGNVRVTFTGSLSPKRLPRHGSAPVSVRLGGQVSTIDGGDPPPLNAIEIAINRDGYLNPKALPACRLSQIQPGTTQYARRVCSRSKVGEGSFSAAVAIPGQAPFPSKGTVTVFNGVEDGRPVLLLHIYGTEPVPTSLTVPLTMRRHSGTFGTLLRGQLPSVEANVGFVTGISLQLGGSAAAKGPRPYLSAGCPAPKGFASIAFPLARMTFVFAGAPPLRETLTRSCGAVG